MSEIKIEGLTIVDGIEKLQDCFLFKGLSFEETRMLANICKPVHKSDGDIIIEENSLGQGLYLIIKGKVNVFREESGTKKTLAILEAGEIFGEMSLIQDMLTSASVSAIGETALLKIDKIDLEQLMESNHLFAAKIYRSFCIVLSERLRKANQKLKEVNPDG
jgi:CRP/FNR family cyclic AMP-dependent transcriptional regulator